MLPFVIASCSKDKRYNVPPEVDVYVQRFIDEGNARGMDIDIKRLTVEFSDELTGPDNTIAGRCSQGFESWRKPVIELSPDFYDFSVEVQEQLIFHELGHCILDRHHRDDLLPNGHFASTMNMHFWNYVVGQDYKRKYYLDELFTVAPSAAPPLWVFNTAKYSDVDAADKTPILQENFDNNNAGWNAPTGHSLEVANGEMQFTTDCNSGASVVTNVNVPTGANFEVHLRFKTTASIGFPSAMVWNTTDEFGLFGYTDTYQTTIGNLASLHNYVTASPCGFNLSDYNTLILRKLDNSLYYFVNEGLVDVQDVQNPTLNFVGVLIGDDASVSVDYLHVFLLN
jgi:hypothetical protein